LNVVIFSQAASVQSTVTDRSMQYAESSRSCRQALDNLMVG